MRAGYVRVSPSLFSGLAAAPAPITGLGLSPCLSANAALPPPIGGWAFGDSAGGGAFYAMFVGYRCGELRKTLRWSFDEIAADRSIVLSLCCLSTIMRMLRKICPQQRKALGH